MSMEIEQEKVEMGNADSYGPFSSDVAYREAERYGGRIVLPSPCELQLDLDSEESVNVFKSNLAILETMIPVKQYGIGPSRTEGKFHVTVELTQPINGHMERILLQACLGSDPRREPLSYKLVLKRDKHPTLFIEGGTKPPKEFKMVSLRKNEQTETTSERS
jgi:hypothetical protein